MFFALKRHGAKGILQKHGLKYVLCIGVIFQMDHAQPLDGIRIPLNGLVHLLLAPHHTPYSLLPATSSPGTAAAVATVTISLRAAAPIRIAHLLRP